MAKRARRNGRAKPRRASGVIVSMNLRYGTQQTSHGNKRIKRGKDARNHWSKEWE
jgi:hypothetical protein